MGPICDDDLAKQLVGPLREGARLHCFVDACKGVFALGLPSCTFTRADGWSSWEVLIPFCIYSISPHSSLRCAKRLALQQAELLQRLSVQWHVP